MHLERTDYGRAEEFFLRAWELLEGDNFTRWRWHIPLLHARGALALARGQHDGAWQFATESHDLALRQDSTRRSTKRARNASRVRSSLQPAV